MRAILEVSSSVDPRDKLRRRGWLAPEITEEERQRTFQRVREKVTADDWDRFDATFLYSIGQARGTARGTVNGDAEYLEDRFIIRLVDQDPSLLLGNVEKLVEDLKHVDKRTSIDSVTIAEGSDKTPVVIGHVTASRTFAWLFRRKAWESLAILGGFILGILCQFASVHANGSWKGVLERMATGFITATLLAALTFWLELIRLKRSPVINWEPARRPEFR